MTTAANRYRQRRRRRQTEGEQKAPAQFPPGEDCLATARACIYVVPAGLLVWALVVGLYLLYQGLSTPTAP